MKEKDIESKVTKFAKSKGILSYKFVSPNNRGVPDRLFITDKGKIFFIEFKSAKGKLTELQSMTIDKMRERGVDVFVAYSVDEGEKILDKIN